MPEHRHTFVEEYEGLVAFGYSRQVDESSLVYYLQKFSDDDLLKTLVPRLEDGEITEVFELLTRLLHRHFSDDEYHEHFLKDREHSREA